MPNFRVLYRSYCSKTVKLGKFETFEEAKEELIRVFKEKVSYGEPTQIIEKHTEFEEIYIVVECGYHREVKKSLKWLKNKFFVSNYQHSFWIEPIINRNMFHAFEYLELVKIALSWNIENEELNEYISLTRQIQNAINYEPPTIWMEEI